MSRNTLITDVAVAVVGAAVVIIVAPGLAVVGIIALLALAVCGVSLALDARRGRRTRRRVLDVRRARGRDHRRP